jgi:hypothetical protein
MVVHVASSDVAVDPDYARSVGRAATTTGARRGRGAVCDIMWRLGRTIWRAVVPARSPFASSVGAAWATPAEGATQASASRAPTRRSVAPGRGSGGVCAMDGVEALAL